MNENLNLPVVDSAAIAEFSEKEYFLIVKVLEKAQQQPHKSMPAGGPEALKAGMEFTVNNLRDAMALGEIGIVTSQFDWSMDRLPHDGVRPANIWHNFQLLGEAVDELLAPENAQQVRAYIDWCVAKIKEMIPVD